MFEREAKLYTFTLGYARLLTADIDESRWAEQPAPSINGPAWIMGHLAVVADAGVALLGGERILPPEWRQRHGPGSTPSTDRAFYPGGAELWAAYEHGHERLTAAALTAAPEAMERPQALTTTALVTRSLPTVGYLIAHIMTSHEAAHLGQLSAWRRMLGLPSVL